STALDSKSWFGAAYGDGKFIAVSSGYDGIAYSPDGKSWKQPTLSEHVIWRSVTYGNGLYVAAGQSDRFATSRDGINWTFRDAPVAGSYWTSTVYGNGTFVSGGYRSGSNYIM